MMSDQLEDLAIQTVRRVQDAFIDLFDAVSGPTGRPTDIQKTLGLHKTLAWKLAKIIDSPDPNAVFTRIPGPAAVEKVLESAKKAGVPDSRLQSVREALEDLDRVVADHAGRRDTFEIILSRLSGDRCRETELGFRKDGFRATSHIWGVQASSILRSVIVWPSSSGDMIDAAVLFGTVDFMRLHADRPWVINRWRPTDDDGVPVPIETEPLGRIKDGSAPMLTEYCSTPSPMVNRCVRDDMSIEDEIVMGPIGMYGASTYFTGEVLRRFMSRYQATGSRMMAQNLELRTPCRRVYFDHLVHKDLFGRVHPRLRVFGELAGRPLYSTLRSNVDELEVLETVDYLGRGVDVLRTSDLPRYDRMIRDVCRNLGWSPEDLDAYRLRIDFPYVPVTITYDYPLPEAP